jgi:ribosomal protein L7/L12
VAELVKDPRRNSGSAAAAMPMMMPGGRAPRQVPHPRPRSAGHLDVVLTEVGDKKINVIKVVREVTSPA